MYRTILVPLDGSPLAERALPYAEALARAGGGRLILMQAPVAHLVDRIDPATGQVHTVNLASTYLGGISTRLNSYGVAAETAIVYREAGDAIIDAARDRQADLVVMATHGRSGLGRWLYGSVADHVLRHAPVPVLLVSAAGAYAWPLAASGTAALAATARGAPADASRRGRRPRVLVPLDGSELAHEALNPACDLAVGLGADLLLLQIVPLPTYPYGEAYAYMSYDPSAELGAAREHLEGVAVPLRGRGHQVTVLAEAGFPAQAIAEGAREQHADVIAMATHGRSGLARLVLGSVATGVLHQAHVPLLLVRPAALATATPAVLAAGVAADHQEEAGGVPEQTALDAVRAAPWPG